MKGHSIPGGTTWGHHHPSQCSQKLPVLLHRAKMFALNLVLNGSLNYACYSLHKIRKYISYLIDSKMHVFPPHFTSLHLDVAANLGQGFICLSMLRLLLTVSTVTTATESRAHAPLVTYLLSLVATFKVASEVHTVIWD